MQTADFGLLASVSCLLSSLSRSSGSFSGPLPGFQFFSLNRAHDAGEGESGTLEIVVGLAALKLDAGVEGAIVGGGEGGAEAAFDQNFVIAIVKLDAEAVAGDDRRRLAVFTENSHANSADADIADVEFHFRRWFRGMRQRSAGWNLPRTNAQMGISRKVSPIILPPIGRRRALAGPGERKWNRLATWPPGARSRP